jgi:hypothetical protein
LVQQDRRNEVFVGERTVGSDATGRFTFVNVPPDQAWQLYGKMESLAGRGALPVRPVQTLGDETTLDVGTLALEPGQRLTGRLVLSDGRDLTESARVFLGREDAFDSRAVSLGDGGTFTFQDLPRELCTLDARVPGYVVSKLNASHDFLNESGLLGRIEADVTDLVLLLDPGEVQTTFTTQGLGDDTWERYEALRRAPLRGAPVEALVPARPR